MLEHDNGSCWLVCDGGCGARLLIHGGREAVEEEAEASGWLMVQEYYKNDVTDLCPGCA